MSPITLLTLFISNSLARVIVGYYNAASAYKGYTISQIPVSQLTHLNYAFGTVQSTGITLGDQYVATQIGYIPTCGIGGSIGELWQLKQSNPHLRTLFSVGGWGDVTANAFANLSQSEDTRSAFIKSATEIVVNYGFDGLDIDWEFPYGKDENDNFVLLVKELRKAFDSIGDGKKYAITIPISFSTNILKNMRLKDLSEQIDWFNLMSYDMSADLNGTAFDTMLYPSSQSPSPDGRSIDNSVSTILRSGVASNKIVMGLPLYGYIYTNQDNVDSLGQDIGNRTTINYADIYTKLNDPSPDWKKHIDTNAKASYMGNTYQNTLITYIDPSQVLPSYIDYVKSQSLGGIFFWSLDMDYYGPDYSFVMKSSSLLGVKFNEFAVCAPKSNQCNIVSNCPDNADFTKADDTSIGFSVGVSWLLVLIVLIISLVF